MAKAKSKAKWDPKTAERVSTIYYPWKTMKVGDEFVLRQTPTRTVGSVASQVHAAGVRYGRKFSVRKLVRGGWVVTRVA